MGKRKAIDWEAIEREYRAGQLSNVQIGKNYGVSESAIRKKANQKGWKKDLAKKVREAVREKLVREEVRDPNADDDQIVEEKAQRGFEVVISHRRDIAALRELESGLIAELQDHPTKLYITQYQGEIVEKELGLTASERAQAANNLANVQHKRIQLERQAFSLDDAPVGSEETPLNIKGQLNMQAIRDAIKRDQENR